MKAQIVHGRAKVLLSKLEGFGGAVIKIDGRTCRWWGSVLPIDNGDRLVASGFSGASGTFEIFAVAMPDMGLLFCQPHRFGMTVELVLASAGAICLTAALALLATLVGVFPNFFGHASLLLPAFFIILLVCLGSGALWMGWSAFRGYQAILIARRRIHEELGLLWGGVS
ncbi:MAG: hypothetical protein R3E18_12070 [Sphingomonadaceae bacterium]|nr:hypothetical protein [Sphingomonadaceae bacterium]